MNLKLSMRRKAIKSATPKMIGTQRVNTLKNVTYFVLYIDQTVDQTVDQNSL